MVSQKVEKPKNGFRNLLKLQTRNLRKSSFGDFLRDHQLLRRQKCPSAINPGLRALAHEGCLLSRFDSVINSRHARESGYPESRIMLKILDSCLR